LVIYYIILSACYVQIFFKYQVYITDTGDLIFDVHHITGNCLGNVVYFPLAVSTHSYYHPQYRRHGKISDIFRNMLYKYEA